MARCDSPTTAKTVSFFSILDSAPDLLALGSWSWLGGPREQDQGMM